MGEHGRVCQYAGRDAWSRFTIELLYGDHEGGQRTITRFGMIPLDAVDDDEVVPRRGAALEPGPAGSPLDGLRAAREARRYGSGGSGAETAQQGLTEAVVAGVLVLDEADAEQLEGDPAVDGGPDQLRRLGRRRLRR